MKEEKLYLVRYINQETGSEVVEYFLAKDLAHLESGVADIIQIQPLANFTNLLIDSPVPTNKLKNMTNETHYCCLSRLEKECVPHEGCDILKKIT